MLKITDPTGMKFEAGVNIPETACTEKCFCGQTLICRCTNAPTPEMEKLAAKMMAATVYYTEMTEAFCSGALPLGANYNSMAKALRKNGYEVEVTEEDTVDDDSPEFDEDGAPIFY